MASIIRQAEALQLALRAAAKEIDNPVLVTYTQVALDNLIEYLKEED